MNTQMDSLTIKQSLYDLRTELVDIIDSRLEEIVTQSSRHDGTLSNGITNNGIAPAPCRRRDAGSGDASNGDTVAKAVETPLDKNADLQVKKFVLRDSLLTELFRLSHFRTIYHIFIAVLIMLILSSMMHDLLDTGTLNLKFEMIRGSFGKLPIVISMWLVMFLSTVLVLFPAFQYWAHQPGLFFGWDYCWLTAYIVYIGAMIILPLRNILQYDLPLASSLIVACEQVRLIMKAHAFIRENAAIVLKLKTDQADQKHEQLSDKQPNQEEDDNDRPCPDFGKFLYFLFAPTLIYRNNYPRTKSVDWGYVATNFAQVLGCTFYTYYVFSHFCVPIFQHFNKDHITFRTFILAVFSSVLPGTLCLFLGFFAVLHSWLNAFAEMLRFGDRMFYRDWWNSTSLATYYRTWNVVVHDWLYTYVYRDAWIFSGKRSRVGAIMSVFFISALVHEYIISIAFRFFYPVLFIEFFFIGVWLMFVTRSSLKRGWNVMLWVSLFSGTGLLMCLYSMEWYARVNCPRLTDNFLYYLTPQSWTCQATSFDIAAAKSLPVCASKEL